MTKKVGWIGLGNMGLPMAHNLLKAGFPLSVYNRNSIKTKTFEHTDTSICANIPTLVAGSDIIFTMLSNDQAVQSVYDGILAMDDLQDKLFVDMSTISQKLSETVAQKLLNRQASFLDAPVAGSTQPAAEGTLIIMVGGDEDDLKTASPYLEKLGKSIKYLGKNGNGIAAKLCVNYFLSIVYLGLAETVLFGEKNNIERSDLLAIINESASGSGATKVKTSLLINNTYDSAFSLNLMLKDILLAKENGLNFPLSEHIIETYANAEKSGFGNQDVISIIRYIQQKS